MKKDTIYIDIEDDITAIIEKIAASDSRVIALVPPKRPEVLHSVVNLKLLLRSAKEAKKNLVLVTTDKSLLSLAGGVGLHTASDLHSKPAVPEAPDLQADGPISALTDEIDPSAAIGDLDEVHKGKGAKAGKTKKDTVVISKDKVDAKADKAKKSGPKLAIPNFDVFRTKLLLGVAGLILIAVGWWFAFVQLPTATIAINAQTSRIETKQELTVDAGITESNIEEFVLAAKSREITKTVEKTFTATGEKNVGKKASGVVTVQNCDSSSSFTIPAGTGYSANNLTFISSADVVVPGASFSGGGCDAAGVADVTVVAQQSGDQYNLTSGTTYSIANQGQLVAGVGGQMTGGTNETATVISQADIDSAVDSLAEPNEGEIKVELKNAFESSVIPIDETFLANRAEAIVAPKVGTEIAEGAVTVEFTYTQLAVREADLVAVLEANQTEQFDENQQTVFNNGIDSISYALDDKLSAGKFDLTLQTSAFIGPKIDTNELAQSVTGLRFSEVVETAKQVPGVTDVEVEFAPFWVFSAPRNAEKIDIQLNVAERSQ